MRSMSVPGPRPPRGSYPQGGPILPGSTIGILGGGQLGRMVALEGRRMGYRVICLDPTPGSPCGQVADEQIVAAFDDIAAATRLAERCDLVLYEFENIDARVVEHVEKLGYVPQGSGLLRICQDRRLEKAALQRAGFPVAPFAMVRDRAGLVQAVEEIGLPCMLKTCTGGYDGKGQRPILHAQDLAQALPTLPALTTFPSNASPGEWVLERFVTFTCEASVIVARRADGEMAAYPMGENIHRDNVLHATIVPARLRPSDQSAATALARAVAEELEVVGLLAVEMFVTPTGLIINELAPRPHNSGHYTWDACFVSQFEQFIRAACGLALGPTELLTPVVMVNVLGEHLGAVLRRFAELPGNVRPHLYGKAGAVSPKRKMGHLTIQTDDPAAALQWIEGFWGQGSSDL